MSDIMLPQVPPAPPTAPANTAKAAEPAAESQADQGFSEVLQTRMQPEEGGAEPASAKAEETVAPTAGQAAAETTDGKPLPPSGNPEATVLAAVTETTLETQAAAAAAQETAVELPPGLALLFPADRVQTAAAGKTAAQQAQVHVRPQPGPLTTGAREALLEQAQASVAQAVREALAESTEEAVLPRPAAEGFAAQIRAMATAQGRAPSTEGALERLLQVPAQPAQAASAAPAPQAVQAALPQEALAGARPLLPATTLDAPFRQPGWDQALSERVMWVANQKFQGAEIKLNPPQLGPIEVRVQLQHEQAHISFTAQHASVREALEAALPRLREMFNANGFNLVDVNVSQHSFAEQQRQAQAGNRGAGAALDDDGDAGMVVHKELARSATAARGGIDLFA